MSAATTRPLYRLVISCTGARSRQRGFPQLDLAQSLLCGDPVDGLNAFEQALAVTRDRIEIFFADALPSRVHPVPVQRPMRLDIVPIHVPSVSTEPRCIEALPIDTEPGAPRTYSRSRLVDPKSSRQCPLRARPACRNALPTRIVRTPSAGFFSSA